jgi:hypothetical protein
VVQPGNELPARGLSVARHGDHEQDVPLTGVEPAPVDCHLSRWSGGVRPFPRDRQILPQRTTLVWRQPGQRFVVAH